MSEFARSRRLLPIACLLAASAHPVCAADVDFSRDIRPILSDACFACHGPDEKAREAELRFDVQDGISKAREDGLLGNDPTDSELIRRVTSDDPDERMPPVESNLSLTQEQIREIVDLELKRVRAQLLEQEITLDVTVEAKDYLGERGYDHAYGARPLRRLIQTLIEDPLAEGLLNGRFHANSAITVNVQGDDLILEPLEELATV